MLCCYSFFCGATDLWKYWIYKTPCQLDPKRFSLGLICLIWITSSTAKAEGSWIRGWKPWVRDFSVWRKWLFWLVGKVTKVWDLYTWVCKILGCQKVLITQSVQVLTQYSHCASTRLVRSSKNRWRYLKVTADHILYVDDKLLSCSSWQVLMKDTLRQGCLWFVRGPRVQPVE